jgi:hypothetical protein
MEILKCFMYLSQCSSLLAFLLAIFIGTYTYLNLKYHHLETSFERAPGSHQLMFKCQQSHKLKTIVIVDYPQC